jgi:hypothetical protein
LYSLGEAEVVYLVVEVVAEYLPAGVVEELGNRIVVVGAELAADEKLEYSVDFL